MFIFYPPMLAVAPATEYALATLCSERNVYASVRGPLLGCGLTWISEQSGSLTFLNFVTVDVLQDPHLLLALHDVVTLSRRWPSLLFRPLHGSAVRIES